MKRIAYLLILFIVFPPQMFATTYYIGTNGGTATQSTGLCDVPYPGSGTGTCSRLNHPFWLMNTSTGGWAALTTGDTVQFRDTGPYYMGQILHGLGQSWPFCVGNEANCHLPSFPDSVHFLGVGAGACHDSGHTGVTNATKLIGINDTFFVFALTATTLDDVECFDISGGETCTQVGEGSSAITNTQQTGTVATYNWTYSFGTALVLGEPITVTGTTNGGGHFNVTKAIITGITNPFGSSGTFTISLPSATIASAADTGGTEFGGFCGGVNVSNNSQNGILVNFSTGAGPDSITVADISMHGLSHNGLWGSKINNNAAHTSNFSDIYCSGVGETCWDTDSGAGGSCCEDLGIVNHTNFHVSWAGAVEVIPNGGTIGGNGYNYAVDQAFNGNGDCLVLIASAATENWSRSSAMNCMQEDFDFLHLADDPSSGVIVNATNMTATFAEGQTFKLGGKTANGTNVAGWGSCNWPNDMSFPSNPAGWNAMLGSPCRASDGMAFSMIDGYTLNLSNVTNITNQSTAWDFSPPYGGVDCQTSLHNCAINMTNTVTMGFPIPGSGGTLPGDIFIGTSFNPFTNGTLSHTQWWNMRSGVVPSQPNTVSPHYGDPLFTAESNINAMNIVPLAGSPLIGNGVTYAGIPSADIFGVTYSSPPPIGAAMPAGSVSPITKLSGTITVKGNVVIR